ncbi:MAG: hypothetical protein WCS52_11145 [bacterium]
MDILAHALYGVTLFSRSGLAGGRIGWSALRRSSLRDRTLWAAAGFGILPDMTSIGVYFSHMWIQGDSPSFQTLPSYVFVLYHFSHSLIFAGLFLLMLRMMARPLFIPALAWPLHILMDSFSHGSGRFQTPLFFPLSDWHFNGMNWWQSPGLMMLYWGLLPILWIAITVWRHQRNR